MGMSRAVRERIDRIRRNYSDEDLRQIFAGRIDDEMFADIGRLTSWNPSIRGADAVWEGFEVLCRGKYGSDSRPV